MLTLALGAGADAALEPLDRLQEAARAHAEAAAAALGHAARVEASTLDPRLRLPRCPELPEAFTPPGASPTGHTTVGVRCNAQHAWVVHVPVRVLLRNPVVVAARSLGRGEVLQPADLRIVERESPHVQEIFLHRIEEAVGRKLRRAVGAGTPLVPGHLEVERMVRTGDKVILIASTGGIDVRMDGRAMGDGTRGARVRVRNLASQRLVEGIVEGHGVVRVPMN